MLIEPLMADLEQELRADFDTALVGLVEMTRARLEDALSEVAKERAKGLEEVATQKADMRREIEAMQVPAAQQEGRVELNIGGYRFETSVQTLRRVSHTCFDAYFSGRYAQDVCVDGSIFVDRDGQHFGHVLEYMQDGVVSVAAPGAHPSIPLLRALKREFGYYCIELVTVAPAGPELSGSAYVIGGVDEPNDFDSSIERYDALTEKWSMVATMRTSRTEFGACVIAGDIYVTGGMDVDVSVLSSVEKYSPAVDTWNAVAPMPEARQGHVSVAVGSDLFVLGGIDYAGLTCLTLKFDSILGAWSEAAATPIGQVRTAAAVGTDIYAFCQGPNGELDDAVHKYDTLIDQWSNLAPMPFFDDNDISANVIDGLIYIVGFGETLRFDPALGLWDTLSLTLYPRFCCATFVLGRSLYAAGGAGDASNVERYDVSTDTWTMVADMLQPRRSFSAVTTYVEGPAIEQDLFDSLITKASTGRPLIA